jgi:hypothetical protein
MLEFGENMSRWHDKGQHKIKDVDIFTKYALLLDFLHRVLEGKGLMQVLGLLLILLR